ncbi:MAG: MFS transporter [Bacteroidetes bacterium]|nr:MFS transporter [Bacteroidota bacterium]
MIHFKRIQRITEESRQTALLALLGFASTLSTAVVFPNIGTFVRDRFVLSDTAASLFAVSYLVPHIIFAFVWGAVADRSGRKREMLVLGYVITAIFHFALPFVNNYPFLLLLRFGEGAMSILGFSIVMALAVDIAKKGHYGRVMGTLGGAIALGTTLAFPLGGALGVRSMVLLCSVGALILLLCAVLGYRYLDVSASGRARSLRDAFLVLRERPILSIPYAFTFVDRFTVGFFAVTFPLYASSVFGMNAAESGRLLAGYLLPFSLLTMPVGRLVDRIGGVRLMLAGSVFYGGAVMLVGFVPGWALLPLMVVCGILASVMYAPSLWLAAANAPEKKRASTMGGFNAAGSIGFALGPIAGALISDAFSYSAAFLAAGITEILCVAILYPILRKVLRTPMPSIVEQTA